MRKTTITNLLLLTFLLSYISAFANWQASPYARKSTSVTRLKGEALMLDGQATDEAWSNAEWNTDFTQHDPVNGAAPTYQTQFKVLYDNEFIYMLIKCYDNEPNKIIRRLSRRDDISGDYISVSIDSYNDKRTAFSFIAAASGTKGDKIISNDGDNEDSNWDPIWFLETSVDADGWTAEIKIPLNQLRFSNAGTQTWGLQVSRNIMRLNESSNWQHIPKETRGWVANYGELNGLDGIQPRRQIEVSPYLVAQTERFEKEEGNPFATGKRQKLNAGLDGKIGITNDLTLDFTLNPDFGQVEADPSQVNLSTFETYFAEKRPFFIEGRSITSFSLGIGDGDIGNDNLFYSRRIGRSPHHYPDLSDGEYADIPGNASIIGAIKLTGKTKDGWSIGVMDNLTSEEHALIDYNGNRRREVVEPLTNYSLARLSKDFNSGNTVIGGIVTATNRDINDAHLNFLVNEAYTGGFDIKHSWKEKKYFVGLNMAFSHLSGTTEAILAKQTSPNHFFQRPDATHLEVDSTLTTLNGMALNFNIGRGGSDKLRYVFFLNAKSPGFDINDMGYMREADDVMQVFWAGYRIRDPFWVFRSANFNFNQWSGWNFNGTNMYNGGNINTWFNFKNNWGFGFGLNGDLESLQKAELRGGPLLKQPGQTSIWYNASTDYSKKLVLEIGGFSAKSVGNDHFSTVGLFGNVQYRPFSFLSLSLSSDYSKYASNLQYVTTVDALGKERYIMADINQNTLSFTIRMDVSITPELTLQYYGMPFISAGKYSEFKEITNSVHDDYLQRYQNIAENAISYNADNEEYSIDLNADNSTDYTISNPNFNFKQFRSNLVLRYEYLPGSVLYLVWSQGRTDFNSIGDFNVRKDYNRMFDVTANNVFLVKFSYLIRI